MKKSLGAYHSSYYNKDQFKFAFSSFRKIFPNAPYLIYSDMGDDFSEYVDECTFYKRSDIRYYGTGPGADWSDNWDLWHSYYQRLKDACEICKTDYILLMEDDVLVNSHFEITKDFDLCGPCKNSFMPEHIKNYLEKKMSKKIVPYYGLCGGSIFNAKKFLENYDKLIDNLHEFHYEYSDNLRESVATAGDGNFTIQFHLLGLEYECSPWLANNQIVHGYPGYVRYIK